ncbi:MAG: tetratricopeptide repeat protein [Planctomycetes bacterium]|nr:tetratricopeptide repeat protein [Planctomycetota bacterium]
MRPIASPLVLAAALASVGAVLLTTAGCQSVTGEDRQVASAYLENAAQYYDAGHYLNAYQQWSKALEFDPNDERAQLGQAMALYQLGRDTTKDGMARLAESEKRLDTLRDGGLGDQSWKAELGYALVQQRWAELYDRAARIQEANATARSPQNEAALATAKAELPRRIAQSEASFRKVLDDSRTEPNFKMTAWLGLAKMTARRGAYDESLRWCRKYEEQVVRSREFWEKQPETYATRLFGARLQEAELRDVLGNTLFKLGQFASAEDELNRLVALQPQRASAYVNRGMLREARGAWDLARSDYARFLQLADLTSDDPNILEAEKRKLLCEERMAAEDERLERDTSPPR